MKAAGLTEKQSIELCDNVGKMLVTELEADVVKNRVKKLVLDYVKKNKIDDDPADLSNKLTYSVKVSLKK
jgi:hypothetical protein